MSSRATALDACSLCVRSSQHTEWLQCMAQAPRLARFVVLDSSAGAWRDCLAGAASRCAARNAGKCACRVCPDEGLCAAVSRATGRLRVFCLCSTSDVGNALAVIVLDASKRDDVASKADSADGRVEEQH